MEQATNQFTNGLQLDTYPIVQNNNTLTDCLNGTLITMQGDEVILLNDMGNRRVDKAFLPSGYLPVGVKQFGGIIYVASYNPITNRSLIGSFPSPERDLSGFDNSFKDIQLNLDFVKDSSNVTNNGGINFVKSTSTMISLLKESNLHVGDKFTVYSTDLEESKDLISNYNNVLDGKIYSPKNKLYTLSLGILNSQNQFVDITSTLKRYDESGNVLESTDSTEYNFNQGYFIYTATPTSGDSIDDTEFKNQRSFKPANIYGYKLTGPLYLKAQINCVQLTYFDVYAYLNKSGTTNNKYDATLIIQATLYYNAPDGAGLSAENLNYYTLELGNLPSTFTGFDLYSYIDTDSRNTLESELENAGELVDPGEIKPLSLKATPTSTLINTEYSSVNVVGQTWKKHTTLKSNEIVSYTYDLESNLYKLVIRKEYSVQSNIKNNESDEDYNSFKYYICVPLELNNTNNSYYLQDLSREEILDFSLLQSEQIVLDNYNYTYSNSTTTINTTITAYPQNGESFTDFKLNFYDTNNKKLIYTSDTLKTTDGTQAVKIENNYATVSGQITIDSTVLESRTLYNVGISYTKTINNESTEEWFKDYTDGHDANYVQWLLTTELFNNCGVKNFKHPKTVEEQTTIENLLKIEVTPITEGSFSASYTQVETDYPNSTLVSESNTGLIFTGNTTATLTKPTFKSASIDTKYPKVFDNINLSSTDTLTFSSSDNISIENNLYPNGLYNINIVDTRKKSSATVVYKLNRTVKDYIEKTIANSTLTKTGIINFHKDKDGNECSLYIHYRNDYGDIIQEGSSADTSIQYLQIPKPATLNPVAKLTDLYSASPGPTTGIDYKGNSKSIKDTLTSTFSGNYRFAFEFFWNINSGYEINDDIRKLLRLHYSPLMWRGSSGIWHLLPPCLGVDNNGRSVDGKLPFKNLEFNDGGWYNVNTKEIIYCDKTSNSSIDGYFYTNDKYNLQATLIKKYYPTYNSFPSLGTYSPLKFDITVKNSTFTANNQISVNRTGYPTYPTLYDGKYLHGNGKEWLSYNKIYSENLYEADYFTLLSDSNYLYPAINDTKYSDFVLFNDLNHYQSYLVPYSRIYYFDY